MQSALDPSGAGADAIYRLWLGFFSVCAVIFLLVMVALAGALLRRRAFSGADSPPQLDENTPAEQRLTRLLTAATIAMAAILIALTLATYSVGSSLFAEAGEMTQIELIGHRWWWEVRYPGVGLGKSVVSANEIHIPTAAKQRIKLTADDVIHSLWVPNLHGKMDLIPGQTNRLVLTADKAGVYRGQCAEFCGLEHAFMALYVVADEPDDHRRWFEREAGPAAQPGTDAEKRGQQVFADNCAYCHTIRGFREEGKLAPDLTHVASRLALGAGRLPNSRGNRAGWVTDAPHLKPGIYMPSFRFDPDDLHALIDYLDRLK